VVAVLHVNRLSQHLKHGTRLLQVNTWLLQLVAAVLVQKVITRVQQQVEELGVLRKNW
jgi:hypothetical protein